MLTMSVFVSLREEHFEKLLLKLKVGEHATLGTQSLPTLPVRYGRCSPTIVVVFVY